LEATAEHALSFLGQLGHERDTDAAAAMLWQYKYIF
jgi:hypothetical protein